MTEVKGSSVVIIPKFVKEKFGDDSYNKWLMALSPESRELFTKIVLPASWYPVKQAMIEPTAKIAELFYDGDLAKCSYDVGAASAEYAFSGVFKFLIRIGSPEFTISKASLIMSSIYKPSKIETVSSEKGRAVLRITEFEDIHEIIELRLKGFMEKGATYTGAKNPKVEITSSMAKGEKYTELVITWE